MGKLVRNIKRIITVLVGLTVVIHLVIILNVKTNVLKKKKLVRNHEEALCNFRPQGNAPAPVKERQECPENGIVTIFYGGGLSRLICSFSTVWAVAKVTSLTPFIPICMYNFLNNVFEDLKITPLTAIAECDIPLSKAAQSYESWMGPNQSIVLPIFSCMKEFVLPRVRDLVRELRIKEGLLKQGEKILRDFVRNKFENPVYVGVLLPRNWQSFSNELLYPNKEFFLAVFKKIRKQKTNPVFVIVGEDGLDEFSEEDILVVNKPGVLGIDLAVLSLCNVSVVGYDGIGVWGAILSKGEAIVFDDVEGQFEEYLRLIPNWRVFV